jgi:hypothetical protein
MSLLQDSTILNSVKDSVTAVFRDTAAFVVRRPDPAEIKSVVEDSAYVYDRVTPPETWWDRFVQWLLNLLAKLFDDSGVLGFNVFTIVVVLCALLLIVYLLIKNGFGGVFYGKGASMPISIRELGDDIHAIDFQSLIAESIRKGDFKSAIRLEFLRFLKDLTDKNVIEWKIDKTNVDYEREISDTAKRKKFKDIARLFEYVWYGDFKTSQSTYEEMMQKLNSFRS